MSIPELYYTRTKIEPDYPGTWPTYKCTAKTVKVHNVEKLHFKTKKERRLFTYIFDNLESLGFNPFVYAKKVGVGHGILESFADMVVTDNINSKGGVVCSKETNVIQLN